METARPEIAWWAAGGTERCPVCLQLYAYEIQVRCVDCDGPLCPQCAIEVHLEVQPLAAEGAPRGSSRRRCPDCPDCREEEA